MKQQKEDWEEFVRSESLESMGAKFGIVVSETFDESESEDEKASE